VIGDTSGPIIGTHLSNLLDVARKRKKEMGDDFLSVEHLVLAFLPDKRFGQQLFSNLQLSEKDLKDAVQAVRGSQRVTDQSKKYTSYRYFALYDKNNMPELHIVERILGSCKG
jgi:ATP-dependent Clp protease ATP-binding subunit ClpB